MIPKAITTTDTSVSAFLRFLADSRYLGCWTVNNDLSSWDTGPGLEEFLQRFMQWKSLMDKDHFVPLE